MSTNDSTSTAENEQVKVVGPARTLALTEDEREMLRDYAAFGCGHADFSLAHTHCRPLIPIIEALIAKRIAHNNSPASTPEEGTR